MFCKVEKNLHNKQKNVLLSDLVDPLVVKLQSFKVLLTLNVLHIFFPIGHKKVSLLSDVLLK